MHHLSVFALPVMLKRNRFIDLSVNYVKTASFPFDRNSFPPISEEHSEDTILLFLNLGWFPGFT